jgi:hexosaminidase
MLAKLVPAPVSARPAPGEDFEITASTVIQAVGEAAEVAELLAQVLRRSTGYPLPVVPDEGAISLVLGGSEPRYRLNVDRRAVVLRAGTGASLFAGTQTLRQLLPGKVESPGTQPGPWLITGGEVVDHPRFSHRGAMLDVSRHFFTVDEVKRYIDLIAQYKINVLHLHLTDDQGWRIEIESWPRLATVGGSTQIGGGPGGFYTKAQYRELVSYAAARYITVIPEIDMPGHSNAALAAYAELNHDGVAPPLFTRKGSAIGFSSLATDKELTYRFVDDVLGELADLTPGEYLHIGTDETHATPEDGYLAFLARVLPIVAKHGKRAMGWHEILKGEPDDAVAQFWGTADTDPLVASAASRGLKVVLSPANKVYLDMKYTPETELGFKWAGYIDVEDAYCWDPGNYLADVPESAVLGVEAPLWSETLTSVGDLDYMAFPRLPAVAELGWSPWSTHGWDSFRERLAAHRSRWAAQGVNCYPSTQIFRPTPA